MRKRLEVMKVRPEFKNVFKMAAMKNGFMKISDFSGFVAKKAAEEDVDIATMLCGKKNRSNGEKFVEFK